MYRSCREGSDSFLMNNLTASPFVQYIYFRFTDVAFFHVHGTVCRVSPLPTAVTKTQEMFIVWKFAYFNRKLYQPKLGMSIKMGSGASHYVHDSFNSYFKGIFYKESHFGMHRGMHDVFIKLATPWLNRYISLPQHPKHTLSHLLPPCLTPKILTFYPSLTYFTPSLILSSLYILVLYLSKRLFYWLGGRSIDRYKGWTTSS